MVSRLQLLSLFLAFRLFDSLLTAVVAGGNGTECAERCSVAVPDTRTVTVTEARDVYFRHEKCTWRWIFRRCTYRNASYKTYQTAHMQVTVTTYYITTACNCLPVTPTRLQPTNINSDVPASALRPSSVSLSERILSSNALGNFNNNDDSTVSVESGASIAVFAVIIVVLLMLVIAAVVISIILIMKRKCKSKEFSVSIPLRVVPSSASSDTNGLYSVLNHSRDDSATAAVAMAKRDEDLYEEPGASNTLPPLSRVGGGGSRTPVYDVIEGDIDYVYEEVSICSPDKTSNCEPGQAPHEYSVNGKCEYPIASFEPPPSELSALYECLTEMKCKEIIRDNLRFGKELGSGEFGIVCKGEWQGPQGSSEVALKVTHKGVPEEEKVKLLQEAAIMKQFTHPNVVRLLGTVTTSEPLVLVLELLANGSLIGFLPTLPNKMDDSRCSQFLGFCRQIAEGMKYLSNKGFVHRDLAARNVLLDAQLVCKISDFGLSRNLDSAEYYVISGGKIPLKWTAPEAIFIRKYSTSSDVWSYGMTLYEIWTFGRKPFEFLSVQELLELLQEGQNSQTTCDLLPQPEGCPGGVYSIMLKCWTWDHHQRPSFEDIINGLK